VLVAVVFAVTIRLGVAVKVGVTVNVAVGACPIGEVGAGILVLHPAIKTAEINAMSKRLPRIFFITSPLKLINNFHRIK